MIWLALILLITRGISKNGSDAQSLLSTLLDNTNLIPPILKVPEPDTPNHKYTVNVPKGIQADTEIILKFESDTNHEVGDSNTQDFYILTLEIPERAFRVKIYERSRKQSTVQLYGLPKTNTLPNAQNVTDGGVEYCKNPDTGYFSVLSRLAPDDVEIEIEPLDASCGRRKPYLKRVIHGKEVEPGDWPWHVAILRNDSFNFRYICGGTLLSKSLVLTAAHCACIRTTPVKPSSLKIELGKHNLTGGGAELQTREIVKVIVHPDFDETLQNDIALLNLKAEADFTDFVKPACLWHKNRKLPPGDVVGTVSGWGFNHKSELSSTLQQVTIPIVSELVCLKSNPIFYQQKLNTNKFCAGFANGTSVCNGDSGGGLMVFVPDWPGVVAEWAGGWYVRGIVSLAPGIPDLNICDPNQYTIFTDVEKYRGWLSGYLD